MNGYTQTRFTLRHYNNDSTSNATFCQHRQSFRSTDVTPFSQYTYDAILQTMHDGTNYTTEHEINNLSK